MPAPKELALSDAERRAEARRADIEHTGLVQWALSTAGNAESLHSNATTLAQRKSSTIREGVLMSRAPLEAWTSTQSKASVSADPAQTVARLRDTGVCRIDGCLSEGTAAASNTKGLQPDSLTQSAIACSAISHTGAPPVTSRCLHRAGVVAALLTHVNADLAEARARAAGGKELGPDGSPQRFGDVLCPTQRYGHAQRRPCSPTSARSAAPPVLAVPPHQCTPATPVPAAARLLLYTPAAEPPPRRAVGTTSCSSRPRWPRRCTRRWCRCGASSRQPWASGPCCTSAQHWSLTRARRGSRCTRTVPTAAAAPCSRSSSPCRTSTSPWGPPSGCQARTAGRHTRTSTLRARRAARRAPSRATRPNASAHA